MVRVFIIWEMGKVFAFGEHIYQNLISPRKKPTWHKLL